MSGVVDDWLSDEKFDFDVTTSPFGDNVVCTVAQSQQKDTEACLNVDGDEEDDEEVFFGPLSHKERCAAVVVKEEEAKQATPQSLSAEQQALLLKESALLSVRIKHGNTPTAHCNAKNSPIAVVHPMPRQQLPKDQIANKENIHTEKMKTISQSKLNQPVKSKPNSKLLHPKFGLNIKPRHASQPESSSGLTKLPVSKVRRGTGPTSTDSSELVDKVSLYGLDKSSSTSSKPRRRSVNQVKPNTTDTSSVSTIQQNKSQAPNLRQSALSTSRLKAPSSKSTSDMKMSTTKGPMRATASQSTIQTSTAGCIPRSNLKLQSISRRNTASTGTPTQNSGIPSVRRRPKIDSPSSSATAERPPTTSRQSLITPVHRTPSSRRQITARQLITKQRESSRTPSPTTLNVEPIIINNNNNDHNVAVESPKQIHVDSTTSHPPEERFIENVDKSTTERPSHSDIINRYKRLMSSQKGSNKATEEPVETNGDTITDDREAERLQNETRVEKQNPVSELPEAKLLEINEAASPLISMSPAKVTDYFLDPFHTGATPPPLIDVVDVLEPERPKEMNLIEF